MATRSASLAPLRRLARQELHKTAPLLAGALVLMVLTSATTGAIAWLLKPIVEGVLAPDRVTNLGLIAAVVGAVFVARGVATYGYTVLLQDSGRRVVASLQKRMMAATLANDLAKVQAVPSGRLAARFIADAETVFGLASNLLINLGRDLTTLAFLLAVMLIRDPAMTLLALLMGPVVVLPIARLGRIMRTSTRARQAAIGALNDRLVQALQGVRHIKVNTAEDRVAAATAEQIDRAAALRLRQGRLEGATVPIMEVLSGGVIALVVLWGGQQLLDGSRSAADLASFLGAVLLAADPLRRLGRINVTLQQALAGLDRVHEVIDDRPAIRSAAAPRPLGPVRGEIRFEGVGFHYGDEPGGSDAGTPAAALDGIELTVAPGETVALVGPSGAGKSTLIALVPRFYDPTEGTVRLDGTDLRDLDLADLRRHIALVSQDVTLFDQSIAANIAFSRPQASPAEIAAAAAAAGAHDFITALPRGYDTLVGERGVRLSGGQRQRLSIAQAMLKDAPVLLLDEATSALDTDSERLVQAGLERLRAGRTTLVIAHRLSTIVGADRIAVLDRGRLAEHGTHAELHAQGGLYARLWTLQTQAHGTGSPDGRR